MANFITLVTFNGTNGSALYGGLTIDSQGDLFGTTSLGGPNDAGTVFEIADTNGTYAGTPTTLAMFNGTDGQLPESSMIIDSEGNLFGTTQLGGVNNVGTVFELFKSSSGYSTTPTSDGDFDVSDGSFPQGSLIANANGNIFGTTLGGGANSDGAVWVITSTSGGAIASFNGTDGKGPSGDLTGDVTGDIFGTTISGGANNDGTVFEVGYSGGGYTTTPIALVSFNGADGQNPVGGLVSDAAGDLFGTTKSGGAYGDGTVFEIPYTSSGYASTPVVLVSFNGTDGQNPVGGLIIDAAGNLFGTTSAGGANGDGTVFEIADVNGVYASTPTLLATFNGTNGSDPTGDLIYDGAGDLFGTTYGGGPNGDGTVFELTGTGFQVPPPPPPARLSPAMALGDFNDDGYADIFFQNVNNGQAYEWEMNSTSIINSAYAGNNTDPDWQVVGSGDFTNNGHSDILFQNINTGQVFEWEMNGTSVVGGGVVGNNSDPDWQVVGTGDFTGNGYSDVVLQNVTTGEVYEWQLNGTAITASGIVGNNTDPSWQVVATGDFTGSGIDDILFQNINTGQVYEWQMKGTSVVASSLVGNNTDPSWHVVGTGDFNGNGIDDILFQNVNTGQVYEWQMNGTSVVGSSFIGNNSDPSWQVVGTGDLNGDGKSDIVFQNVNTGQVFAWLMNGTTVIGSSFLGNNTNPTWHVTG